MFRLETIRWPAACGVLTALLAGVSGPAAAQGNQDDKGVQEPPPVPLNEAVFSLGEIVVVLAPHIGEPGIGGSVITREQAWTFNRNSLDEAVNMAAGVSSTFDANGRRNESDIFVRGFGRWQVPLTIDGVRIYLPADNRLDFSRFLTTDVAAIQIQKGYASVLDGPGAMGGAINLVTTRPTKPFEAEGGVSLGGGDAVDGWNGYMMAGRRQPRYYVSGSAAVSDRDSWRLSAAYEPTTTSLQRNLERLSSDTNDWRVNLKAGYTPNDTNEYAVNFIKQAGEKGAPLNVYNNPPSPPNSYWRWPYWDVQNISFLSNTQLGNTSYVKGKAYYNTFRNALDAYDDISYTTQSAAGRFHSPYDDHAWGGSVELGATPRPADTIKAAIHYRNDNHVEGNINRPTNPALRTVDPDQEQSQYTWSIAAENTYRVNAAIDVVAGISYDKYAITRAEEFTAARGLFEYPKGGSDAFNWQAASVWRYNRAGEVHASVSDRARFPVIFELYSTRFGTATPNPDLGPERATNLEVGWRGGPFRRTRVSGALFYSNVRDLIQTVVLPDSTTQTENVGDGDFYGAEISVESTLSGRLNAGGNYTYVHRTIKDALQPNLRATGVPTSKAFLYATWRPVGRLSITPNLDLADDRWSDVNTTPLPAFPYVETGAYAMFNVDATYALGGRVDLGFGFKNLFDDYYELSWGLPQPGRAFYVRTRMRF